MRSELYPEIKALVSHPGWPALQALLEEECQSLITQFENGSPGMLEGFQQRLKQTRKIMRMPGDLIREHEAKNKK